MTAWKMSPAMMCSFTRSTPGSIPPGHIGGGMEGWVSPVGLRRGSIVCPRQGPEVLHGLPYPCRRAAVVTDGIGFVGERGLAKTKRCRARWSKTMQLVISMN